jgi:hypothetical protein
MVFVELNPVCIPGTEIAAEKFINLMYLLWTRRLISSIRRERQLKLRGMVSEGDIRNPVTKDHNGDLCCYVIKRGLTTLTTIGRATGFESFVRRYFANESKRESVEAVVLPYDNDSGPFSRVGDSGSIIVDALDSLLSSLARLERQNRLISPSARQCTGSGRSSRPNSRVPTSTSSPSTRYVSFFRLFLSYF